MKSIITNYRYWVLTLLSFIVIFDLIAVPQDSLGLIAYAVICIGFKFMSLAAAAAFCLLYINWHDNGQLPELDGLANEE